MRTADTIAPEQAGRPSDELDAVFATGVVGTGNRDRAWTVSHGLQSWITSMTFELRKSGQFP
jgi:hypothetical protein